MDWSTSILLALSLLQIALATVHVTLRQWLWALLNVAFAIYGIHQASQGLALVKIEVKCQQERSQ